MNLVFSFFLRPRYTLPESFGFILGGMVLVKSGLWPALAVVIGTVFITFLIRVIYLLSTNRL